MMNFQTNYVWQKNMTKLLDSRVPLLLKEKFQKMYQIDLNHKNSISEGRNKRTCDSKQLDV
jgi:hypothetical protein